MDLVRRGVLVVVQQPVEDDEAGAGTDTSSSRRLPREIFILGTTHVSETAGEDAMRVVRSVQPQNVVVELCKSRAPIMYDPVPDPNQLSVPSSDATGAAAAPARDLFLMGGASLPQTLMRSIQLGATLPQTLMRNTASSLICTAAFCGCLFSLMHSVSISPPSPLLVGITSPSCMEGPLSARPRLPRFACMWFGLANQYALFLFPPPLSSPQLRRAWKALSLLDRTCLLRRAWKALSLLDRARLASALLQGGLKGGSLEQSELKGAFSRQRDSTNGQGMEGLNMDRDVVGSGGVVEKDDAEGEEEVEFLSAVFQEVARQFPTLIGPLVHERDALPYQEASIDGGSAISDGSYQWFTTAASPAPTTAGAGVDTASWKLIESAFGFSFLYPSSYIVTINCKNDPADTPLTADGAQALALNRKNDPADAPLTADGAQALAVVGNFVTFDTMSVIRYAFTPNPDKLAPLIQRILPNGVSLTHRRPSSSLIAAHPPHSSPPILLTHASSPHLFKPQQARSSHPNNLSTSLVEDTVFPNQPIIELPLDLQKILSALASPAGLSFERAECNNGGVQREDRGGNEGSAYFVITETCRGRIEEGKGGVGECVSVRGADLVQPIVRRHIGRILLSEGYLYVITVACTEARRPEMSTLLQCTTRNPLPPPTPPLLPHISPPGYLFVITAPSIKAGRTRVNAQLQ
ncbi:unnamed protein product [Closterium sp. NIES-65]|nr:unnamed protein product [Closterium sp. NIES-65]